MRNSPSHSRTNSACLPLVQEAVGASYEQWDGKGWPGKLSGQAVPIGSRLAQLAEYAEVAHRIGGVSVREVRRVLSPGGRLLFIEHVRADGERLLRWQHRLNGLNRFMLASCNCNRPTLETTRAAGSRPRTSSAPS